MNDPQVIARLDAIGELVSDQYADRVLARLQANPLTGWIKPSEELPEEGRAVFFMTESGHWAGERHGNEWCDWGDKGIICESGDVLIWQYAPEVE